MTQDMSHAPELAHGALGACRIERIQLGEAEGAAIRFSAWQNGELQDRPLALTEYELLGLICEAVKAGVFSDGFLRELHAALYDLKAEGDCKPGV